MPAILHRFGTRSAASALYHIMNIDSLAYEFNCLIRCRFRIKLLRREKLKWYQPNYAITVRLRLNTCFRKQLAEHYLNN